MANSPLRLAWLPGLLMLWGCASGPPPKLYVLDGLRDPVAGVRSDAGRKVVRLKPVSLPDYLDTTDILMRDGHNEIKASSTGRWGERLSVGVTRALRDALARRLPGMVIDLTAAAGEPARTLLIDIDGFAVQPDGNCVMAARWTILGENRESTGGSEQATVVTTMARSADAGSDTAVVTAMSAAIGQLADHIAVDLTRGVSRVRTRSGHI